MNFSSTCFPHPDLDSTFPQHGHEPSDIEHNREPAPGNRFQAPDLPTLIADCIVLGDSIIRAVSVSG